MKQECEFRKIFKRTFPLLHLPKRNNPPSYHLTDYRSTDYIFRCRFAVLASKDFGRWALESGLQLNGNGRTRKQLKRFIRREQGTVVRSRRKLVILRTLIFHVNAVQSVDDSTRLHIPRISSLTRSYAPLKSLLYPRDFSHWDVLGREWLETVHCTLPRGGIISVFLLPLDPNLSQTRRNKGKRCWHLDRRKCDKCITYISLTF